MEPTENDPIARRLRSLGNQSIDPDVVASHRNLMASVPVAPSRSRLRPLMVGSLLAGSLLGGMGLAAAAPSVILPSSASEAAQEALNKVTLGVVADPDDADDAGGENGGGKPDHTAKNAAKASKKAARAANHPAGTHGVTRSTVDCRPGFTGNHGQHVSGTPKVAGNDVNERQVAAKQECGKPVHAPNASQTENSNKPASPGKSDEEHGKSSDAGVESGQSSAGHPNDHANEKAAENVGRNADGVAGNSAGHRPADVPAP